MLYALCYFLTEIDIELWSKVKAKATLERKTMREVIFESLKQYITPGETSPSPDKKKKAEMKEGRNDIRLPKDTIEEWKDDFLLQAQSSASLVKRKCFVCHWNTLGRLKDGGMRLRDNDPVTGT